MTFVYFVLAIRFSPVARYVLVYGKPVVNVFRLYDVFSVDVVTRFWCWA